MGFHRATSLDRGGERSRQQEGDADQLHDESSGDGRLGRKCARDLIVGILPFAVPLI